ncbi:MAG: hypothetical protein NUV91_09825 [Candidatus Omnitrophica bacterium]|nr:hypothetical protein [Candidatus Omnitrophota bacterium]
MMVRIKDQKGWESLAILTSLICHVVILGGVIFVFPVKNVAYKPPLIFLGSILDREDLMSQALSPQEAAYPMVSAYPQRSQFYPAKTTEVIKPSFSPLKGKKKAKTVLKSTFEEQGVVSVDDVDVQSLGIDPNVPSYVPLRSYLR